MSKLLFFLLFCIINSLLYSQSTKNTDIECSDVSFVNKQNMKIGVICKLFVDKTEIKSSDSEVCFAVNISNLIDSMVYVRKYLKTGTNSDADFKINIVNCETNERFILLNNGRHVPSLEVIKLENYTSYFCFDFKKLVNVKVADSCFRVDKNLNGLNEKGNIIYGKYYIQIVYTSDYFNKYGKLSTKTKKYLKGPLYSNVIEINYSEK